MLENLGNCVFLSHFFWIFLVEKVGVDSGHLSESQPYTPTQTKIENITPGIIDKTNSRLCNFWQLLENSVTNNLFVDIGLIITELIF